MSKFGWFITILVVSCVVGVGIAGYVFYEHIQDSGRTWTRRSWPAIMSQYMPHNENQPLRQHA